MFKDRLCVMQWLLNNADCFVHIHVMHIPLRWSSIYSWSWCDEFCRRFWSYLFWWSEDRSPYGIQCAQKKSLLWSSRSCFRFKVVMQHGHISYPPWKLNRIRRYARDKYNEEVYELHWSWGKVDVKRDWEGCKVKCKRPKGKRSDWWVGVTPSHITDFQERKVPLNQEMGTRIKTQSQALTYDAKDIRYRTSQSS